MLTQVGRALLLDVFRQKSSQQCLRTPLFRPKLSARCVSNQTPVNTIFMFVPEHEVWVIERMGKFHRLTNPGLNVLLPIIDKVRYVQCLKEIPVEVNKKAVITADNITLSIDSVLYLKVKDAYLASYEVEDPEYAVSHLAQSILRSEIGKTTVENVLQPNGNLKLNIAEAMNKVTLTWGIECLRYEIRDVELPPSIREAMKMEAEAERKNKAAISLAEGKRSAKIIEAEAEKVEMISRANGKATALCIITEAHAKSIEIIAKVLKNQQGESSALAYSIAQQYVSAFEKLAKTNNVVIVPHDVCDISKTVMKALSIHGNVSENLQSVVVKKTNEAETTS